MTSCYIYLNCNNHKLNHRYIAGNQAYIFTQILTNVTVKFKNHLVTAQKRTKTDSLWLLVCGFCEKVTKFVTYFPSACRGPEHRIE